MKGVCFFEFSSAILDGFKRFFSFKFSSPHEKVKVLFCRSEFSREKRTWARREFCVASSVRWDMASSSVPHVGLY